MTPVCFQHDDERLVHPHIYVHVFMHIYASLSLSLSLSLRTHRQRHAPVTPVCLQHDDEQNIDTDLDRSIDIMYRQRHAPVTPIRFQHDDEWLVHPCRRAQLNHAVGRAHVVRDWLSGVVVKRAYRIDTTGRSEDERGRAHKT